MTGQIITIEVNSRQPGKHNSRTLRSEKRVPAVVYGPKTKTLNFTMTEQDAVKFSKRAFENTIFTFKSSDSSLNNLKVLRKDLDIHPVSRRPIHMDFFAPDMTKMVRVNVVLRFVGKCLGVSEGGVFNTIRRDVEIECLPTEIPEFFEVDVTDLGLNQSFHVSDVKFPSTVKVITSTQETIANVAIVEEVIAAPAAEAAAATAEAPAAGAAAAPGAAPAAAAGAKAAPGAAGGAKAAAPAADAKKDKK